MTRKKELPESLFVNSERDSLFRFVDVCDRITLLRLASACASEKDCDGGRIA
jgi:hypothetical protein